MAQPGYSQLPSAPPSTSPSAPPSAPMMQEGAGMDKAAMFAQQQQQQEQPQGGAAYTPIYPAPPPPYSEQPPPMQPYPPQPYVAPGQPHPQPYAAPGQPYPAPGQPYPAPGQPYPAPGQPSAAYPVVQPVIMQQSPAPAAAPTSVVVIGAQGGLAPGICTVCRKGKIENSPSCCTYFCCLFLCVWGILPGIIAYFCCCREPKCTNCGYSP